MESHTADLGGPVHYLDYGGDGSPLVLAHGIGGAALNWMGLAPRLTDRYHVLAVDLAGFGLTPLAGRSGSFQANQRLLDRFIEEVAGAPVVLCGHSMGGLIALTQAAASPATVSALVLFAPAIVPGLSSPAPGFGHRVLDLLALSPRVGSGLGTIVNRRRGPEVLVDEAIRGVVASFDTIDPGLLAAHAAQERTRMTRPLAYAGYLEAWRSIRALRRDPGFVARQLAGVTAPVLVIHGVEDPVIPYPAMVELVRAQPRWTLESMPGVGHDPFFEALPAVVEILERWLEGHAIELPRRELPLPSHS